MSSPITYLVIVNDKDLDASALWAMINYASTSTSHSSSKHKPLTIKYHHNNQSPSMISNPSPPPPSPKFPHNSAYNGKVVQYPKKVARICSASSCEMSPLAIIQTGKVYSSPEIKKANEVWGLGGYTEVSP
ncbi:hypothetical protein RYX36_019466 [Vicia faba]